MTGDFWNIWVFQIQQKQSEDMLQYYDLPTCFHCKGCTVAKDCYYKEAMSIVRKIHDASVLNNQDEIRTYIKAIMEIAENPE